MPYCNRILILLSLMVACAFPRPADVSDISCTVNEFVGCDKNIAKTCNESGDGLVMQDCGIASCNADAKRCNQCLPNTDSCSIAENLLDHCGADGLPAGQATCLLGCKTTPPAHCTYLEPRYLPDVCDTVAMMPGLTVSNSAGLNTDLDTSCTGGVVHQNGAADICVVRYGSIDITPTGTLAAVGARALALVADSAVTINGQLTVNAFGQGNGAGGGTMLSGDRATTTGGGGAGYATAGANGGSATADGGGGLGGGKATDPSLLTVLVGGTRPNRGVSGGQGSGGGGGAATLIACRGEVSVTGTISAAGGGGPGGRAGNAVGIMFAGGGGGAGGNVVLQGLSITVTGQVFANGGGGGAGWVQGGPPGQDGSNGTRSATDAALGGNAFSSEGAGGAGGVQGTAPKIGLRPAVSSSLPGGGGGSIGFFQTYTPTGITPTLTPSAASPAFGTNKTISTR